MKSLIFIKHEITIDNKDHVTEEGSIMDGHDSAHFCGIMTTSQKSQFMFQLSQKKSVRAFQQTLVT